MEELATSPSRTRRARRGAERHRRSRAVAALGVGACVAMGSTMAAWTDQATISGVTVATGSVNLQVGEGASPTFADSLTSSALNATGLMPGQAVSSRIAVRNVGTGAFPGLTVARVLVSGDADLATALQVTALENGTAGAGGVCTGAGTATSVVSAPAALAGGLAAGGTPVRWFCVRVALPASAASTLQSKTASLRLVFDATT